MTIAKTALPGPAACDSTTKQRPSQPRKRIASRKGTVALALAGVIAGCGHFMAGYRAPTVRAINLGMTTAAVANLAGAPQRREALATSTGTFEVWYYVIPAPGGGLTEQPVLYVNGQVVAIGNEAVRALMAQPVQNFQTIY